MASREPLTVRSGRIKRARRLATRRFRDQTAEFLAEGPQAVREAVVGGHAVEVFVTPAAEERWAAAAEPRGEAPWSVVDDDVMTELSETVQTQGIVARCRKLDQSLDAVLATARLVAICADIRDPGNVGTVIRCADAAGADAVVIAGDSVDPYNPKAVRASAGSLFHVPVAIERDLTPIVTSVRSAGLRLVGADGTGETGLFEPAARLSEPTAWAFGNEAHGLPAALRSELDGLVAIPLYGRAESLNLATAAAVCLYESARSLRRG